MNSMKVSELDHLLEKVEVRTDKDANMLRYVKECIQYTQNTLSLPNCNDCGLKNCKYKPRWGSPVRINCPFWKSKNQISKTTERVVEMSFADAVLAMKQGKKVRMPWWGGYWYIANGTLRIHCADDKDFDAFSRENTEPLYTLSFMAANCWEIVTD